MGFRENGERLKQLRGQRSQLEIALEVGISQPALAMYEKGVRNPRDRTKIKLAKFYGVSVGDIFFQDDTTNSSI